MSGTGHPNSAQHSISQILAHPISSHIIAHHRTSSHFLPRTVSSHLSLYDRRIARLHKDILGLSCFENLLALISVFDRLVLISPECRHTFSHRNPKTSSTTMSCLPTFPHRIPETSSTTMSRQACLQRLDRLRHTIYRLKSLHSSTYRPRNLRRRLRPRRMLTKGGVVHARHGQTRRREAN
jgi:hypothetical protein